METDGCNGAEDFFQVLIIGILITSSRMDDPKKILVESLRTWGVILNRSDFLILDHSKVGNFTITIARYTLDYVQKSDTTEKKVYVEGSVAIETDCFGNRQISISSKSDPLRLNSNISSTEMSLTCGKM